MLIVQPPAAPNYFTHLTQNVPKVLVNQIWFIAQTFGTVRNISYFIDLRMKSRFPAPRLGHLAGRSGGKSATSLARDNTVVLLNNVSKGRKIVLVSGACRAH